MAVLVAVARSLAAVAALSLVLVAGCSSTSHMVSGGNATGSRGGGMMGGAGAGNAGYRFSASTCVTPSVTSLAVRVMLADMGMDNMMGGTAPWGVHMMLRSSPVTVRPGSVTFVAVNRGWRTHELVVLPLAAGSVAGRRVPGADGRVSEVGSLGEASAPCGAGAGTGIPAGSGSWVTIVLPAGRYELICNLPNHYADGMCQQFTVA